MNQYKFKQNDLPARLNSWNGKNEHCFWCTLYVCACDAINNLTGLTVIPNETAAEAIYWDGNAKGMLTDETNHSNHGAYVMDDTGFFQLVLDYYKSGLKVVRTGSDADYLVLNIKTANGGHFRELNYDPWKTEVKGLYMKSVRGYKVMKK